MTKRILVAGIGNLFLGDDAFGVEVIRELARRDLPDGVRVEDFGIRSYDLAFALSEPFDAVILVDAAPRGHAPGTVYLLELDWNELGALGNLAVDGHSLDPVRALQMALALNNATSDFGPATFTDDGFGPGRVGAPLYLVGCEPSVLNPPDVQIGLSDVVQAAVPIAAGRVESLVQELLGSQARTRAGVTPV